MRFLPRLPRFFVRGFKPIKRPSFPVSEKHLAVRGKVNDVKPLYWPKSKDEPRYVSEWGWDGNGSPV